MASESASSLSIIIPVLNEAPSLPELVGRIRKVVEGLTTRYEIIVVDDGSTDDSFAVLERLRRDDNRLKVIQLRCVHGKATALAIGFKEAQGDLLITMDGDLQDQPEEIPQFLTKLAAGHDLVCGWRVKRNDSWGKILASRLFLPHWIPGCTGFPSPGRSGLPAVPPIWPREFRRIDPRCHPEPFSEM